MAVVARRFFLGDTGDSLVTPEMMDLQNVNDLLNDPTDKDRLKFVYEPNTKYGIDGRNFIPQNTDMYGQGAGLMNSGDFLVGSPRQTPYNDVTPGAAQCPYGFYSYGGTCVPSAAINPSSPWSIFGPDGANPLSKGVIEFIQPPKVTYLNQPFQIAAKIMNVGGRPGKYAIRTTIPQLNIADSLSGSIYLNPNQEGWLYQTVSFSNTNPTDRVIQAKVDLVMLKQVATGGDISYELQDTNNISIPGPLASTIPVGPPQGLPINNYTPFPMPNQPPYPQQPAGIFPPYYSPNYGGGGATIMLSPFKQTYRINEQVAIYGQGFAPYESVTIKVVYTDSQTAGISIMGMINIGGYGGSGSTRSITKSSTADPLGRISPVTITIPRSINGYISISATGSNSRRVATRTVGVA